MTRILAQSIISASRTRAPKASTFASAPSQVIVMTRTSAPPTPAQPTASARTSLSTARMESHAPSTRAFLEQGSVLTAQTTISAKSTLSRASRRWSAQARVARSQR